jgi:hypothetical protein
MAEGSTDGERASSRHVLTIILEPPASESARACLVTRCDGVATIVQRRWAEWWPQEPTSNDRSSTRRIPEAMIGCGQLSGLPSSTMRKHLPRWGSLSTRTTTAIRISGLENNAIVSASRAGAGSPALTFRGGQRRLLHEGREGLKGLGCGWRSPPRCRTGKPGRRWPSQKTGPSSSQASSRRSMSPAASAPIGSRTCGSATTFSVAPAPLRHRSRRPEETCQ